ncbi:MAG: hypothetical protein Q7T29_02520 [Gallionella sp.]|nr:hypothetical protein [Gallionella sp.]
MLTAQNDDPQDALALTVVQSSAANSSLVFMVKNLPVNYSVGRNCCVMLTNPLRTPLRHIAAPLLYHGFADWQQMR